jgi:hypothetical protein
MDIQHRHILLARGRIRAILLLAPMLVACSKSLPVSIHGVNYTADPFSYVVTDPDDPKNTGGGELIESYAAGGTMCCYELPRNWRPGIKVSVRSAHWLGKSADNSLREVVTTQLAEVPRYADGKPGELWVLRAANGSIDLVSSDFQPNHPKWPGKVKGWPVPSLEYQRERWDLYVRHEADNVATFEELLKQLAESPDNAALDAWNTDRHHDSKSLLGFTGPDDEAYRKKLKLEYETGLVRSRSQLKRLRESKP